ncbi:MAG TPA: hypothetical protein VF794_31035 [Archangium sp.]|jgi:hypothetical protein|uniref:hypothetical protein n=1 Tax=Archangium sp. TaxID=1872627 RepID=UPI002EDB56D4
MKRLLLSTAATALLLSPLACDIDKTGNQLLAKKVMVGTLLSTPTVDVSYSAMAGLDAGTLPDGGIREEDRVTVPGQTAAFVFFGTREGDQGQPEPIANATVRLEAVNGKQYNLDNTGVGTYGHTSGFEDDAGVKYQSGATYRFVAVQDGTSHVGTVEEAPSLERIAALHPAEGYVKHMANQGLTLQRPPAAGGKPRTLGFVTVFPLSTNGEKGQPTYSNVPKEPLEFLQLVAVPTEWQAANIPIPGSAFPQTNSNYLVVFQTVKTGGAESDNLFIGSALLVGTADVGMVHTQ